MSVRFNQAATPAARGPQVQTDAPAASSASPLYPLVEGHLLSQLLALPPAAAPTAEAAEFSAYPNPLARATTVRFAAVQASPVQVRVYNALGQLVATLYDGPLAAGQVLERPLDAAGLSAGVYTCRLSGPGPARTIKLIVNP